MLLDRAAVLRRVVGDPAYLWGSEAIHPQEIYALKSFLVHADGYNHYI